MDGCIVEGHQMKPLFTLHAGEIAAGEYIEHEFKRVKIWVPTKDTGVDLLVTNGNKESLSLQIKYSKNFESGLNDHELDQYLRACGWWTLNRQKIQNSEADFWIFILRGFESSKFDFIIIPPDELLRRLDAIYPKKLNSCHTYLWVTKGHRCWTTRGLGKANQSLVAQGKFLEHEDWDFSGYLNNWTPLKELNSVMN
jgi:hypothetical protein